MSFPPFRAATGSYKALNLEPSPAGASGFDNTATINNFLAANNAPGTTIAVNPPPAGWQYFSGGAHPIPPGVRLLGGPWLLSQPGNPLPWFRALPGTGNPAFFVGANWFGNDAGWADTSAEIEGISIDCADQMSGISLMPHGCKLTRNLVYNWPNYAAGINLYGSTHNGSNCTDVCQENELWLNYLYGTAASGSKYGLDAIKNTATLITDTHVWGNLFRYSAAAAINLVSSGGWRVHHNHLYQCQGDAIYVAYANQDHVEDNDIDNFGLAGVAATKYGGVHFGQLQSSSLGNASTVRGNRIDTTASGSADYSYVWVGASQAGNPCALNAAGNTLAVGGATTGTVTGFDIDGSGGAVTVYGGGNTIGAGITATAVAGTVTFAAPANP